MGDSAGGNLAAVVALRCARERRPRLALQVLVYPVTDCRFDTPSYLENGKGHLLDLDQMRWFFDCYTRAGSDSEDPSISPLRAAELRSGAAGNRGAERIAPALVITAEHDPLRDEGEAYAAALRESGVDVSLTRYDGMIHAFFGLGAVFDAANDAMAEVGSALHAAFGTL
jgi:acetyl esterase